METKTLDQEKFDTVKELAELSTNIATGRAELKKLEETTAEYIVSREEKAEARVLEVLKESREALEATTQNHKELSGFNQDLEAYASELKRLTTDISALFQDFNEKMDGAEKDMEEYYKEVHEVLRKIKLENVTLVENRKRVSAERADLREETRLLEDRRGQLERGFEELKRLKNKQK